MRRTIPSVEGGLLYPSEIGSDRIVVGTPAWYGWLEHHTSFLFADLTGSFTAREGGGESGALEWKAFRTRAGKLHHLWLGPARTLTLARLQAAAQALSSEHAPAEPISLPPVQPATAQLSVQETAVSTVPTGPPSSFLRTKLNRPREIGRAHV